MVPVRAQDFNRFNSVNWLYRRWIFWGFAGTPRDFFGSRLLALFDHPRHLKFRVPPWAIISGCQTHAPTCTIGVISYNHSSYKRGVMLQQTDLQLRTLTFNTTYDKGSCTSQ